MITKSFYSRVKVVDLFSINFVLMAAFVSCFSHGEDACLAGNGSGFSGPIDKIGMDLEW